MLAQEPQASPPTQKTSLRHILQTPVTIYCLEKNAVSLNTQQFDANIKLQATIFKIFQTPKSIIITISARISGTQQYSVIKNEVTVK
jgi:hypothetical protein